MRTARLLVILVILLILTVTIDKAFRKNITQVSKSQKEETKISPTKTPAPTLSPIPTVFLPPTQPTPLVQEKNDNTLIYPNSTVISSGNNLIILQSSDDPQTITDWYQGKIEELKYNANSFVKTNSNGNVMNKLVASNGKKEVDIEILKPADSDNVEIRVRD